MSSIFSVGSGSGQDFYSMFFNTGSSSSSKSNAASGIFGNNSTIIGDMSMIKSGTYKKLLNSYYTATGVTNSSKKASLSGSSTSKSSSKTANTDSTANLKTTVTDAESLMKAMDQLGKKSLYSKTKKDDKGNPTYDMDSIGKAVKGFVESYNSYIESSGNLNSTSMLNNALGVVKSTAKNAGLLSEIGITIGADNKLKLDEDKLKEAKATTVNSLFAGSGSYGSYVQSKASATYRTANSALYSSTHAASYGYSGSYSLMGTNGTTSLDRYL